MGSELLTEKVFVGPDGTRFSYVDEGEGSPIVLLHGWSSSLQWFRRNVPELAKRHRVLALDFRKRVTHRLQEVRIGIARLPRRESRFVSRRWAGDCNSGFDCDRP